MGTPNASDITQTLMWTALPNGIPSSGKLAVSVFVSPQLSAVMSDQSTPLLSVFDDFIDWPSTLAASNGGDGISFTVTLGSGEPIAATLAAGSQALDSASWQAIFVPANTTVQPYAYQDLSNATFQSFGAKTIVENVASLYGTVGLQSPTSPMLLTAQSPGERQPPVLAIYDNETLAGVVETIASLGDYNPKLAGTALQQQMFRLKQFYAYPTTVEGVSGPDPDYKPSVPKLDFHQALTSLGSFPVLLRRLGLVFDLVIPYTFNPDLPAPATVQVTPAWTSVESTTNVSPLMNITLSASQFIAKPRGSDYLNGMIDLTDTSRFYVTDLDGDLAAHRLLTLDNVLESMQQFWSGSPRYNANSQPPYYKAAVTVPALRSNGLQIIWTNWGTPPDGLVGLLATQTNLNGQLTAYTGGSSGTPVELYADDVMRGHRIDLYTASDPSPAWRSLHGRSGTYGVGTPTGSPTPEPPIVLTVVDEGFVTPSTTQQTELLNETNPDVYIHEVWMKWDGWSLSAQRPGSSIGPDNKPQAPPNNPAVQGANLPQLSATFQTPNVGNTGTNPYPLPKLRFGNSYLLRARGVDLAGNSVPLSSTDASTAYGPVTHYRYEPVPPPVLASTAPLSIAESTWLLVLLDDRVNPITPNGRWLFPPKTSEHMCEEHGMFDGFVLGQPPKPSEPPDGSETTYDLLADTIGLADGTIPQVPGVELDARHKYTPYFPATTVPVTPWLPDPLSAGAGLLGLPSEPFDDQYTAPWAPSPWPQLQPVLLLVEGGTTRSNSYAPATGTSAAQVTVTLPPAEVAVVWLSSALTDEAASTLGVYQWIVAAAGGVDHLPADFATWLANGQIWQCSPFRVLRMVHAVRTPLIAPALQNPQTDPQTTGGTSIGLEDANFLVDEKSTSVLDFQAQWIDPYDNPADPDSNPADPASFFQVKTGPAFKLHVPDPTPIGPESMPLTVYPPDQTFSFGIDEATDVNPATHFIGDTKHHLIGYQVTATSRFAEMFETSFTGTFTGKTSQTISELGINLATVVVYKAGTSTAVPSFEYEADATTGKFTYLGNSSATAKTKLTIEFQPTTTITGPVVPVEVLSTARPPAPKIAGILPAWSFSGPAGDLVTGIEVQRTGGYLRVFLDRPWFTTGAGEMLGVVTPAFESSAPTPEDQLPLYTMMGLDPINYIGTTDRPWPVIPPAFDNLAKVPVVPARGAAYSSPPQLTLAEDFDSGDLYNIWPYDVNYDAPTGTWYSDVCLLPGQVASSGETVLPPPGYFVRLSVVRFQPYSIESQEVSTVTTATIAQPVADRLVVVLQNHGDPTNESVLVSVVGPGYEGWRPPSKVYKNSSGKSYVKDGDNPWAPQIYDTGGQGRAHTSMMVVDVQIQDSASWLEGELSWVTVHRPIRLDPHFSSTTTVEWGGLGGNSDAPIGVVKLPYTLNSKTKMRLRVSEIEYHDSDDAPAVVNAELRRPFVAFIPVN